MSFDQDPIRVVLATDSLLIGDGLAALFAGIVDVEVVGRARGHIELIEVVEKLTPAAVIVSIRTPITTMPTIVAARKLHLEHPALGIVVIADRGDGFALELLRGGASRVAYLLDARLPSMDAVLGALREVCSGQTVLDPSIVNSLVRRHDGVAFDDLTPREIDVLEQMSHGLSNRGVAAELNISVKAIEKYVTIIFRKLELSDQTLVDRRVTASLIYLRSQG